MEGLIDAIATVEKRTAANAQAQTGDYEKDGLLYCGKCNTPKQHRGMFLGVERIVPCICCCKKAELDAEEKRRQWEKQQELIKKQRRVGFPESDMREWTFAEDDGNNPRIMQAMRNYVDNFPAFKNQGKGLLLHGGLGTGKTYAAACIVNALIDTGRSCLMTNFARVLNTLWSIENKQGYIDSLNKFDLLVLDDLGAERRSEYAQEQVFNVIDSRYRAKLPLIVTTNLTMKELTALDNIGNGRIYDRLLEMCHPVEISGKSRRRQKVANEFKDTNKLLGL